MSVDVMDGTRTSGAKGSELSVEKRHVGVKQRRKLFKNFALPNDHLLPDDLSLPDDHLLPNDHSLPNDHLLPDDHSLPHAVQDLKFSILDTANQAAPSCTIPSDSGPCWFCLQYANSSAAMPEAAPEGLIVDEDFDRIRDVVGPSFRRITAWPC
uniref:Uncharacterized protein n=1 Tax=Caenorhabditis japonica TaxID=281687 RepID=A0A8R1DED3_CAEJA